MQTESRSDRKFCIMRTSDNSELRSEAGNRKTLERGRWGH